MTNRKDKIIKVQYDYEQRKITEIFSGICCIISILSALSLMVFALVLPRGSLLSTLTATFILCGFASYFGIVYYNERARRRRDGANAKRIIENGHEIIGTIINLNVTELKDSQYFNYDIEYEDSNSKTHKLTSMITPAVVEDTMCIKEKDLPLRAVIYVYENDVHLYALINPPIVKISGRRAGKTIVKLIPLFILAISLPICWALSVNDQVIESMALGFGSITLSTIIFLIQHKIHIT